MCLDLIWRYLLILAISDAFAGGFVAGIVERKSLDESVDMGHWLASLSIKELGPQYVHSVLLDIFHHSGNYRKNIERQQATSPQTRHLPPLLLQYSSRTPGALELTNTITSLDIPSPSKTTSRHRRPNPSP